MSDNLFDESLPLTTLFGNDKIIDEPIKKTDTKSPIYNYKQEYHNLQMRILFRVPLSSSSLNIDIKKQYTHFYVKFIIPVNEYRPESGINSIAGKCASLNGKIISSNVHLRKLLDLTYNEWSDMFKTSYFIFKFPQSIESMKDNKFGDIQVVYYINNNSFWVTDPSNDKPNGGKKAIDPHCMAFLRLSEQVVDFDDRAALNSKECAAMTAYQKRKMLPVIALMCLDKSLKPSQ